MKLSRLLLSDSAGYARSLVVICWAFILGLGVAQHARGAFIGPYSESNFLLVNDNADGTLAIQSQGALLLLTGGNNGTGITGTTDLTVAASQAGLVEFQWVFSTLDLPEFDSVGYLVGGVFTKLADTDGEKGSVSFMVTPGQAFGFRIITEDNTGEPGILEIRAFNAPFAVPEPATFSLIVISLAAFAGSCCRRQSARPRKVRNE